VDEQRTIFQRLAAVKAEVGAVAKGDRNQQQGFNFRGIDAVVNASAPALNKHEVIVLPEILEIEYSTVEIGRNKTQMAHVTGKVCYWFYGPLGDFIRAIVPSEAMDAGDKAVPKFMSVAYRIALLQTLNLPTDEPDPDSESFERSPKTAATTVTGRGGSGATGGEKTKTAITAKTAETAKTPDLAKLANSVISAKTQDQLNAAWKAIGAEGQLDAEIDVKGEKTTFRKLLYSRNEELHSKSGGSDQDDAGRESAQ
jgi:ERF superfamily